MHLTTFFCTAMSSRYQIVVQGEASETDSDDEVYITSLPPPQSATGGAKVGVYVLDRACKLHHVSKMLI